MQHGAFSGTLPPNSHAIPLSTTNGYLDSLEAHGVTSMREIVASNALADPATYAAAGDVVEAYQAHGFSLILALGGPLPSAYETGPNCAFSPSSDWGATANALGTIIADFMTYLESRTDIDPHWLATHVEVEPFNEFDSLGAMQAGVCVAGYGSPIRGARLYHAIESAFAASGIPNAITTPSIVGYYFGPLSATPTGDYDQSRIWLEDYYAAGGGGRANVHIYCDPTRCDLGDGAATASTIERIYDDIRAGAVGGAPVLSEVGLPVLEGSCDRSHGAMADAQRAILYGDLASSGIPLDFWRLLPFDTQDGGCSYGVVPESSWADLPPSYDLAGQAVLGISGTSASRPCTLDGESIDSGDSVIAYQTPTVAAGETCTWQSRTCEDGTLGGSYAYASCAPASPPSAGACPSGLDITAYPSCTCPSTGVQTGTTCTSTAPSLGSVSDATTFWSALYACIQQRSATTSELAYWVGQTGSGITSLGAAYQSFFDSTEYLNKHASDSAYVSQLLPVRALPVSRIRPRAPG